MTINGHNFSSNIRFVPFRVFDRLARVAANEKRQKDSRSPKPGGVTEALIMR